MTRLAALALAALLSVGIVTPAFAQGHRPDVPPGHDRVPHCDWNVVTQQWEYSNPSRRGFEHGHDGHHILILIPLDAPRSFCATLPPTAGTLTPR